MEAWVCVGGPGVGGDERVGCGWRWVRVGDWAVYWWDDEMTCGLQMETVDEDC